MEDSSITDRLIYESDPKLPPLILEEMLKQVDELTPIPSEIAGDRKGGETLNTSIRSSSTSWLPWNHWIACILHNLMVSANEDYFKFDLSHFDSGLQVTTYNKGDHYTWHHDGRASSTPAGMERKLSISFMLSDKYTGGQLEFESKPSKYSLKPKAGTAIIFPAWLSHRVKPVKSGTRISIVTWMNGPRFK
tara:strand:- start:102 stop:674 length:573 start_codon:yes stop_codon:yes gene_type:complete